MSYHVNNKSFELSSQELYLVVREIKARDVFTARDEAEKKVGLISTLSGFFHHKEAASWQSNVLMINLESKKARLVLRSQNPMLMCSDSRMENAAIKLNNFIKNFSLKKESFQRFDRALELHALALRSDSPDNQLLNLWVAIETLVPSKLGRTKAKVNNIIDSIVPFITIEYIETLTTKLTQDFRLWNRVKLNESIDGVDGQSERERLIKILVLPEYKHKKDKLFTDLQQFYLLRNRAHYLSSILSDTSKLSSLLDIHSQRVDWQIRRIYRTRNLIDHAGQTPTYINVLIKNIHDYLDTVINIIGRLASDGRMIATIDGAFKYVEISHMEYLHDLKNTKKIQLDNIDRLIISSPIK